MRPTFAALVTAAALFPLAPIARGDPFDRRHVPADARWVVHLDIDAARGTPLWADVAARLAKRPGVQAKLGQVEAVSGLRFPRDLHDVTVYGQTATDEAGVAVIHADIDRDRLTKFVAGLPGFAAHSVGGHDVAIWGDDGKPVFAAFHGPSTVVFGRTEAHVVAALDALDGKGDLLPADSTLTGAAPPATRPAFAAGDRPLAFVAAADPAAIAGSADAVPGPLRQVVGGWLTVTEAGTAVTVRAALMADTADAAEQLRTAADGLKAMAAFATAGPDADPQAKAAAALVTHAHFGRTDRAATLDLSVPLDQVERSIDGATIKVTDGPPTTEPAVKISVGVGEH